MQIVRSAMKDIDFVRSAIEKYRERLIQANDAIYRYAELAYEEYQSMEALCAILTHEGFSVEKGIAGIPTCFLGRWGRGGFKAGILGEYDALDGLSQEAGIPRYSPRAETGAGHGCGHCCLGVGSLGAALVLKEYLLENNLEGEVIYYGCPAEEGAGSKQFMARAGVFDEPDFVFTWHPSTLNEISANTTTAIMGANFTFRGVAAHAGGAPWLGRSALDAAELMNVGCNYLREHIPDGQRIHYAYGDAGGTAPNVVPAFAKVKYEVRARTVSQVKELFERVKKCAKGAALMADTQMECSLTMAFSDFSQNRTLAETASACLLELGAPKWEAEEEALAGEFLQSYDEGTLASIRREILDIFGKKEGERLLARPLHTEVLPFCPEKGRYEGGSTDVGDVSYVVPTAEIHVACAALGTIGHTWQMAAQAGSVLGHKGLLQAAMVLALSCIRTMEHPDLVAKAKMEILEKNGGKYECPLPSEVQPPIGIY